MGLTGKLLIVLVLGGGGLTAIFYALAKLLEIVTGSPDLMPDNLLNVYLISIALVVAWMLIRLKRRDQGGADRGKK